MHRVLRPRPPAVLVPGTVHKLAQHGPGANVEGTDAGRRVQFVSCNCEQVHSESVHVDRNFADRLAGIGVQDGLAVGFHHLRDLFNRIDRTSLIVCVHY